MATPLFLPLLLTDECATHKNQRENKTKRNENKTEKRKKKKNLKTIFQSFPDLNYA